MLTSPDWSNLDNLVPVDPTNVENSHKIKQKFRHSGTLRYPMFFTAQCRLKYPINQI